MIDWWLSTFTAYLQYPRGIYFIVSRQILYCTAEEKTSLFSNEWININQYQSINRGNFSLYASLCHSLPLPLDQVLVSNRLFPWFKNVVCLWVSRDQQGTYNRFCFLRSIFSIAGRTKLMRCDGCAFRKFFDMHIKQKEWYVLRVNKTKKTLFEKIKNLSDIA